MPNWLTIVLSCITGVTGIFGLFGITMYINERVKHKALKKNKQEDDAEAENLKMKNVYYGKLIVDEIGKKIEPLEQDLYEMKADLGKLKKGVQASNRADLEDLVAKADEQGWMSSYDKARFNQLYEAYHNLGKNGVMDSHKKRLLELPDCPPKQSNIKNN